MITYQDLQKVVQNGTEEELISFVYGAIMNYRGSEEYNTALIAEEYRKCKYDRDAICEMLGLEKSALSARLKKAKEIK